MYILYYLLGNRVYIYSRRKGEMETVIRVRQTVREIDIQKCRKGGTRWHSRTKYAYINVL